MEKKMTMSVDEVNGIKYLRLQQGKKVVRSISLSDEGTYYLDDRGADIVLDFDDGGNVIGIELIGL